MKSSNNNSLISIIMPAYNAEAFIEETIQSVITQTFRNWELIIINDCSVDSTASIIQKFKSIDKRINIIENKINLGVSKSRNTGVSIAKGEWIAFLDSDDLWEKTKLEKQMQLAFKYNAEFIFTGASYINENNMPYPGTFKIPLKVTYDTLKKHNVISCSSVLVKSYFFNTIQMEDDSIHEDYVVWLRILKSGVIAYGINEPLLVYRLHRSSKSGNKLKTFKMTYSVFRFIGINPFFSVYYTSRHLFSSILKYQKILRPFK